MALDSKQTIISLMACYQLAGLVETCSAIVGDLPAKTADRDDFPSGIVLSIAAGYINNQIPGDMLGDDGLSLDAIDRFCRNNDTYFSKAVYSVAKLLFTREDVCSAINSSDVAVFRLVEDCFGDVAAQVGPGVDMPSAEKFVSYFGQFRTFLVSPSVSDDDKETIWGFLQYLTDMMVSEESVLEDVLGTDSPNLSSALQ